MAVNLFQVGSKTGRVERHWIGGAKKDLEVYRIPLEHLYFNIENGRYADRMIRLRQENPGVHIDASDEKWKEKIEEMLAGEHKDTARDSAAFSKLIEDIEARDQLRPGVVLRDGGVLDGNRRLAALRRLWKKSKNTERFRTLEAVILPDETTEEDRWRIEAGLQLGINERWDYSPVNELLKVRQGLRMYEDMIKDRRLPAKESPVRLVTRAIYGKTEADIQEMDSRLRLIDEYLEFIDLPEAYDRIGQSSERFLEASRIVRAAENHSLDPKFIAKLKAVLFYIIDNNVMDNWDLRDIYYSLGGDPRKKGPKSRRTNMPALNELLDTYPDARKIRDDLKLRHAPRTGSVATKAAPVAAVAKMVPGKPLPKRTVATPEPDPPRPHVDRTKVEEGTEIFKRRMEIAGKQNSIRKLADRIRGDIKALEDELSKAGTRKSLSADERASLLELCDYIAVEIPKCKKHLKS
jgi:hypothetical protein